MTDDPAAALRVNLRVALQTAAAALVEASDRVGGLADAVERAVRVLRDGGTLFFCGNGGSAAQAQHWAAELVGRFANRDRPDIPAIALTTNTANLTAIANDQGAPAIFARQVAALVRPGDLLIVITTSGDSENVLAAVEAARHNAATDDAVRRFREANNMPGGANITPDLARRLMIYTRTLTSPDGQ